MTLDLKVVLPFEILLEQKGVTRLVVETTHGSIGVLPLRLDCVAFLVPGIVVYEVDGEERYVAVAEGILVKTGSLLTLSVRHGITGVDVKELQNRARESFLKREKGEKETIKTLKKLESVIFHRAIEEVHRG
jgi:F-type H+-transporting ATPase subunit epsilon